VLIARALAQEAGRARFRHSRGGRRRGASPRGGTAGRAGGAGQVGWEAVVADAAGSRGPGRGVQ
jgi:hypothetical protein